MAKLPDRPRLRASFWFDEAKRGRVELTLMNERRELVHRETLDIPAGSAMENVHLALLSTVATLGQRRGVIDAPAGSAAPVPPPAPAPAPAPPPEPPKPVLSPEQVANERRRRRIDAGERAELAELERAELEHDELDTDEPGVPTVPPPTRAPLLSAEEFQAERERRLRDAAERSTVVDNKEPPPESEPPQ